MPKLPKLPAPPLPAPLQPPPPRPGEGNGKTGPLDQAAEAGITVVDWVDERTSLSGAARWMMFRKVPKGTNWFYTLGSATMFAFLSQAVTGVFLAMYYRPDPSGGAYESIRYVTNEVFLGQFVRGMHKWGSSVMVILVFLHMARTFFFGAYKYPRELNWVIGVVLLILTMLMSFILYLDRICMGEIVKSVSFNHDLGLSKKEIGRILGRPDIGIRLNRQFRRRLTGR